MTTPKLTGPQRALLDAVVTDLIRRDDSGVGRPLYQLYRTDTGRTVRSRTMDRLFDLDLVRLAPQVATDRRQRRFVLTHAGQAALTPGVSA